MEPKTAKDVLQPLLESATKIAEAHGGSPEQLTLIHEALETLDFAVAWAQLTWDHSFPAWLQFCAEQKAKELNRSERRRLVVVKP